MQNGPEEAHDAAWIAEADLDVIETAKTGSGIDGLALIEEAADTVERGFTGVLAEKVKMVEDRAVEETGFGISAGVLWWSVAVAEQRFIKSRWVKAINSALSGSARSRQ